MRQLQALQNVSFQKYRYRFDVQIQLEFPKTQSKILVNVKETEEKGPARAMKFKNQCEQIENLRELSKYGNITDKDLAMEVPAQDWPRLYDTNFRIYSEACKRSIELAELQMHKQEMYIFREQEYRKTIEEIKADIERRSQKPLQETKK